MTVKLPARFRRVLAANGHLGGEARAKRLSATKRRAIAKAAAIARWSKEKAK